VRILLVGDYPPDPRLGSAKVLFKLQRELHALGHTCDLMCSDALGRVPRNPHLRQAFGPVNALSAVRRMFRERGAYDVVDVASAEGLWIALARHCGWFDRTAVIARSNGLEHLNYRRMLDDHRAGLRRKPWTRRLFHPAVRLTQVAAAAWAADRLLVLNHGDWQFAVEHGWKRPDLIDIVHHGVSTEFLDDAPPRDHFRGGGLLFCGSWTDVKGVAYLATAFSRLVERGPSARLTILGGSVPREVILSAFTPSARPLVTVIDRAPEPDVMAAYRAHDALVWPSTYEGFGMVVIEAMSQRLPVIATPVGCAGAFVSNEETGLLVPPRSSEPLTAAMARLLGDASLRTRLADAAFDRVRGMSWRRAAGQTLAAYERAVQTHARAA
jgi:glycosyltransferase involved in cell wall biosynthesis